MTTRIRIYVLAVLLVMVANIWAWNQLKQSEHLNLLAHLERNQAIDLGSEIEGLTANCSRMLNVAEPNHDFARDLSSAFRGAELSNRSSGNWSAAIVKDDESNQQSLKSVQDAIRSTISLEQLNEFLDAADSGKIRYTLNSLILTPASNSQRQKELWNSRFDLFFLESTD